jgi:hypothetical protein
LVKGIVPGIVVDSQAHSAFAEEPKFHARSDAFSSYTGKAAECDLFVHHRPTAHLKDGIAIYTFLAHRAITNSNVSEGERAVVEIGVVSSVVRTLKGGRPVIGAQKETAARAKLGAKKHWQHPNQNHNPSTISSPFANDGLCGT